MGDTTYQAKVYEKQGGDEQVIADGGKQTIEEGGAVVNQSIITKVDNYTVPADESGATYLIGTDAKVFTLPATAKGLRYRFVNIGADGAVLLAISPAAADAIFGGGLTSVDDKDLNNTKATAKEGDTVELLGDGDQGWLVLSLVGIWAKEA